MLEDQIADVKTAARLAYLKVYDLVFRHGHTTQEDRDQALFLAGHATDLADEMAASVIG
jgi:metallophosphoesterase superfamily enzyme